MNSGRQSRIPSEDKDWQDLKALWTIRDDTCYMNHGSWGISPQPVRHERRKWIDRLDCQPMDFYLRQLEPAFHETRDVLSSFVGTDSGNLVFVENATYGMNVVANGLELSAGDEVLLSSHEYGAVKRIWERRCSEAKAICREARLELPFTTAEHLEQALFAEVTPATRLIVISHITSETGTILPVKRICDRAKKMGIAVCIDGPHAPAQVPINLDELGCDFYTASCHKWLCAPLGTGFLFASPTWHCQMKPLVQSWGRLKPNEPKYWDEEMIWMGTRDPSGFFTIGTAIEFLRSVGLQQFRQRTHWLASEMLKELRDLFQTDLIYPSEPDADTQENWFGSMCELPLPDRVSAQDRETLQLRLWKNHGIEVPIFEFEGRKLIRVSFHLYNDTNDIDRLVQSLKAEQCFA